MKRALIAVTVFFLALFALGFALGTIRAIFVAPRVGQLAATFAEIPVMLTAAFFVCRWALRHWQVANTGVTRWAMVIWFLVLLSGFEIVLGAALFERTIADQLSVLTAPAGLVGLAAQIIAALLPAFVVSRDVNVNTVDHV